MRYFHPFFRSFATVLVLLTLDAFQGNLLEAPDVAAEEYLCKTRRPIYSSKGVHNSCICKSDTDCQLFNPPTTAATQTESPAADWSKLDFPIGGSK